MIRQVRESDFEKLRAIHEKYYRDEFCFAEFERNFLLMFVSVDNDDIISAGGVRTIAEAVIITDKSKSARIRRKALYEILQVSTFTAAKSGYGSLHAFIQDNGWQKHLLEAGFRQTKGNALVIDVE